VAVAVAVAGSFSSDLTPSLRTSVGHRCSPKTTKDKKTKKQKKTKPKLQGKKSDMKVRVLREKCNLHFSLTLLEVRSKEPNC